MARAHRYILPEQIYHVTHRCHDRSFLLRFARDREAYRVLLRDRAGRFPVMVLGYCLTSNHVHLLLKVREGGTEGLSRFMQSVAGDFAQAFNRRKNRTGAYWGDRYHAVMIDGGKYLWRCLRYIDLNMVRAGVVRDPSEWGWCGYQELLGLRKRYRVVAQEELAEVLGPGVGAEKVFQQYARYVAEGLQVGERTRDARWTESVAVGREAFVREIGSRMDDRMQMTFSAGNDGTWTVKEEPSSYSAFPAPINASKAPKTAHLSP